MVWDIPLVIWWPFIPALSSPNYLYTHSLLADGVVWEAEKALMLSKHCSAITKTSVCYQCCFDHKSRT